MSLCNAEVSRRVCGGQGIAGNKKAADVVAAIATAGLASVARVSKAWRKSRMNALRAASATFQDELCCAEKEGRLVLAHVGPGAKERAVIAVELSVRQEDKRDRRHCNEAVRSFDIPEAIVAILRLTLMEDTIMVLFFPSSSSAPSFQMFCDSTS